MFCAQLKRGNRILTGVSIVAAMSVVATVTTGDVLVMVVMSFVWIGLDLQSLTEGENDESRWQRQD